MSRPLKRILIIVGGALALLLLAAGVVPLLVDVNAHKARFEAAASEALGMEVRIGGRLRLGLLPGLQLTMEEVRILDGRAAVVASAGRVKLRVALLPLLHREVRLRGVELVRPVLAIERTAEGTLNVERLGKAMALLGALDGARVSLSDGTLRYADRRSGGAIEATGFDLNVSHLRFARGSLPPWRHLSLRADLACDAIRARDLSVSDVKVSVLGKDGVLLFEPVTMRIFAGRMAGSLRADLSGPVPLHQFRCSLPGFRIEEFLRTLSPTKAAEGAMDFSASLSMRGKTAKELLRTAAGEISLRGQDLTLVGTDLDRALSRFESSQSFNLVDVGAVFFAGPLGLAVTKGYNFASLFRGTGGSSPIRTLVSDWQVEGGVARAKDVALSTPENRIALRGGLDFVHEQFADVTVAVIDTKGCARAQQVIRGSFANPVVEKPRILMSLAGPVLKVYRQARGLFPAGPCDAFYSGSVAPPSQE